MTLVICVNLFDDFLNAVSRVPLLLNVLDLDLQLLEVSDAVEVVHHVVDVVLRNALLPLHLAQQLPPLGRYLVLIH